MTTTTGIGGGTFGYEMALQRLADWLAAFVQGLQNLLLPARAKLGTPLAMASVTGLLLFSLLLLGTLLTTPSGYGLEDFLGWGSMQTGAAAPALLALWDALGLRWLAQLSLLLDSLAFVPCYAATLGLLTRALVNALLRDRAADEPPDPEFSRGRWQQALVWPLLALVLVDLVENALGQLRLGAVPWTVGLAALALALVVYGLTGALSFIVRHWHRRALAGGLVLGLAVVYLQGALQVNACLPGADSAWLWPWRAGLDGYGCAAHHGKRALLALVALGLLILLLLWLFAVLVRNDPGLQAQRARLRAAIGDMLLRSRYVLIALALMAVLCLAMDQARDVVYAALTAGGQSGWMAPLLVLAIGAAAGWCFAFSAWLWTRSACEIASAAMPPRPLADLSDRVARDWARLLGLAPLLMLAVLALLVCGDAIKGAYAGVGRPGKPEQAGALALAAAGLSYVYIALLLAFVWDRMRQPAADGLYYNARERASWLPAGRGGVAPAKYKLWGVLAPQRLFALSLWGFFAARAIDLGGVAPPLAQAEIALMLAFWLCVFGWLSLLEIRQAVPWVLMLLLSVGVLGLAGANGHHALWSPLLHADAPPGRGYDMLAAAAALGLLLHGLYALLMWRLRQARPWPVWAWPTMGVLALLGALGVMKSADSLLQGRALPASTRLWPHAQDPRPTLEAALADWLRALCAEEPACRQPGQRAAADDDQLPVYFIATAGGGVRAAAWTASLLQQWQREEPRFAARTFAISGVSGGAVGAAVFRACRLRPEAAACVAGYLGADLLSPLLSAWMFEDVLGSLLPSAPCTEQPGCGFLSRAAWFEAGMERIVPGLRQGLAQSQGRPHLLLNSTWVESGERAIASDLRLGDRFPGARDQLDMLRHDLPLSTAAHNAARFPYTNAIGELRNTRADCLRRGAAASAVAASADAPPPGPDALALRPCGHLADGGYYDNSGMASLADALRGLRDCLAQEPLPACRALPPATLNWLRAHLRVHIVMLRNTPRRDDRPILHCPGGGVPSGHQVSPTPPQGCRAPDPVYRPQMPICADPNRLFTDELGPPLALLNGSGIGAHGRRDEALMAVEALGLQQALRPVAIDLLQQEVHYPLGWYLSGRAAQSIGEQAAACPLATLQSPP